MREHFQLPEHDRRALNAMGKEWETIHDGGGQWLLLSAFPIPLGYNVNTATVALMISPGYPDSQLDMAWFFPALVKNDGKAIGATSEQIIDGKPFQRWSRHRTAQNPWRPGEDGLASHLLLVNEWLERELNKG